MSPTPSGVGPLFEKARHSGPMLGPQNFGRVVHDQNQIAEMQRRLEDGTNHPGEDHSDWSDTREPLYHQAARYTLSTILSTPPANIRPRPLLPVAYNYSTQPNPHSDMDLAAMRTEWLIRQADEANPYRVRTSEERGRSQSPRQEFHRLDTSTPFEGVAPGYGSGGRHAYQSIHVPVTLEQGHATARGSVPSIPLSRGMDPHTHEQENREQVDDVEDDFKGHRTIYHQPPTDGASEVCEKEENLECEFAAPCRMDASPDGLHFRKVVSHVFGRNKAVTKLFPQEVWVHYCRKHYQRARYRADQWPFTQCDLLLESLRRMEDWNGVIDFELTLRRREKLRVEGGESTTPRTEPATKNGTKSTAGTNQPRKCPTAIISPAPDWLRRSAHKHLSFDEIRALIERIRQHMIALRAREREQQAEIQDKVKNASSAMNGQTKQGHPVRTQSKRHSVKLQPYGLRPAPSMVRFPDIEILPNFQEWVCEAARRQRCATAPPLEIDDKKHGKQNQEMIQSGPRQDIQIDHPRHQQSIPFRPRLASHNHQGRAFTTNQSPEVPISQRVFQGSIGRAGTNCGTSASQQRRSQRVFQLALDRGTRGSGKRSEKPVSNSEPYSDSN